MKEDFLHYLWQFKQWKRPLATTAGESIEILFPGHKNRDGGPDFLQARLRIGDTLWAGHVEIHCTSSDWLQHKHQNDAAYNNVILHVVIDADREILRGDHQVIPCCSISGCYDEERYQHYLRWLATSESIACNPPWENIPDLLRKNYLTRLCIERFEERVEEILDSWHFNRHHWEETFYTYLLRSFGMRVNADAFYGIGQHLPLRLLQQYRNNLFQLEALLLGQAHLLEGLFTESYPRALQEEYAYLQKKHALWPIAEGQIKFLRLRPCSFPTLRLAQFAQWIHQQEHGFEWINEPPSWEVIDQSLKLSGSEYWETHYTLDKCSPFQRKELGKQARQNIYLHAYIPFWLAYGKVRNREDLCEHALNTLECMPPEQNRESRFWESLGLVAQNALETQGLYQLKKSYCAAKKCLHCSFGVELLK